MPQRPSAGAAPIAALTAAHQAGHQAACDQQGGAVPMGQTAAADVLGTTTVVCGGGGLRPFVYNAPNNG